MKVQRNLAAIILPGARNKEAAFRCLLNMAARLDENTDPGEMDRTVRPS